MDGIVDMHCHILPGIDDGPKDSREAMEMLRMEYQQGVRRIVCTPHCWQGMFEASMEERENSLELLRRKLLRMRIPMELFLGCEFHTEEEMTEKLRMNPGYRMAGSRYILTEFSPRIQEAEALRYLQRLLNQGFRPVIAHIERYRKVNSLPMVRHFIEMGAYIQVNAGSLLGMEGWSMKQTARKLLDAECVHFVGSDAHDVKRRVPNLGECAIYLEKKIGKHKTHRILIENPGKMINNEYI